MKRVCIWLLLMVALPGAAACESAAPVVTPTPVDTLSSVGTPSPVDSALAQATGLPGEILQIVAGSGANLRPFHELYVNEMPAQEASGATVDVAQDEALSRARGLQDSLPKGYLAFVSEMNFGFDGELDHVSVLKVATPYDALRVFGTNGINYDLTTADVIARLKKWDAAYGLSLRGVSFDWVEAEFRRQPTDMDAFAREVYEFCPDVVDQGTGTVGELAAEMKRTNSVYLWWD